MARTKGSGWGGAQIMWQICPHCGKKKAYYDPIPGAAWHMPFRCTACGERSTPESGQLKKKIETKNN